MGEIWRSGITSNYVTQEIRETRVVDGRKVDLPQRPMIFPGSPHANDGRAGISISATIASKGGGRTNIKCWFGADEFRGIAEAMVKANPSAAKEAFASAIESPNKTDEENARKVQVLLEKPHNSG